MSDYIFKNNAIEMVRALLGSKYAEDIDSDNEGLRIYARGYIGGVHHSLLQLTYTFEEDAEPVKHGQWIIHHEYGGDPHFINEWLVCSCCGGQALYERGGYEQLKTERCPWCGAKMEKGE